MTERCEKCGAEKPEMLIPQLEPRALKAIKLWSETPNNEERCPNLLLSKAEAYSQGLGDHLSERCQRICRPLFPAAIAHHQCPCSYHFSADIRAHVGKVLAAQKPEFKPYAAVRTKGASIGSSPYVYGTMLKIINRSGCASFEDAKGYRHEKANILPITNEAEALRILEDVTGQAARRAKLLGLRKDMVAVPEYITAYVMAISYIDDELKRMEGDNADKGEGGKI